MKFNHMLGCFTFWIVWLSTFVFSAPTVTQASVTHAKRLRDFSHIVQNGADIGETIQFSQKGLQAESWAQPSESEISIGELDDDSLALRIHNLVGAAAPGSTQQIVVSKLRSLMTNVTCDVCKTIVFLVQHLLDLNVTREKIVETGTSLCITFHIESDRICEGITRVFEAEVLTVLRDLALSPHEVCGVVMGEPCATPYDPFIMWNVTFPDVPKPPVKELSPPKPGSPTLRVLQLSDIHVDFQYKAGANADCGEPICCRSNDGPVKVAAGRWGDYHSCDLPPWTLEHLLQHLSQSDKFDYILWAGDLPAHDDWNQTRATQIQHLEYLTKVLLKYFPNTPVYPTLGNHESVPVNSFPPPFIHGKESMSWLYNAIAKEWSAWLPNDTMADIHKGGYYTTLIKPGYRIVSLNSNYCNNENWWLLLNMTDPAGELQWLIKILQHSEDIGEKVHIIGHIPPGEDGCVKAWSWNFYKIVDRYESTITCQFYGHTHNDLMEVFYHLPDLKRATNVAYVGPSVTTAPSLNPAYRVYTIDGFYKNTTFTVLDHETHILNLTEANTQDNPRWQKEYSAKEAYNLTNLFPADWDRFVHNLLYDDVTFQKYYQYYYSSHMPGPCNNTKCKETYVCKIRMARSHDPDLCKDLIPNFQYKEFLQRLPKDPYDIPQQLQSRIRQRFKAVF